VGSDMTRLDTIAFAKLKARTTDKPIRELTPDNEATREALRDLRNGSNTSQAINVLVTARAGWRGA